jgi:hypothetical protein
VVKLGRSLGCLRSAPPKKQKGPSPHRRPEPAWLSLQSVRRLLRRTDTRRRRASK